MAAAVPAPGAEPNDDALDRRFETVIRPFLQKHCLRCHGAAKQEAKLDLSGYSSVAAVVKHAGTWETVAERLEAGEMPPETAKPQPESHERRAVLEWIRAVRDREAVRNAGDPGPVLARRLSSAEFDYSIRDLTGVDIRPSREFPVDPANEAGFDNSGESLAMSPALLKKYLTAARHVADHIVLKPEGFVFAPHAAVTETDRDKYCVHRIVDFYRRHDVDYADYFFAAWRFRSRKERGRPDESLDDVATANKLSPRYLAKVWSVLDEPHLEWGPLGALRAMWLALPADPDQASTVRHECERMRDFVVGLRMELKPRTDKMQVEGISKGSQPLVLWRNRQLAAERRKYSGGGYFVDSRPIERKLSVRGEQVQIRFCVKKLAGSGADGYVIWKEPRLQIVREKKKGAKNESVDSFGTLRELLEKHAPEEAAKLKFGQHPAGGTIEPNSFVFEAPTELIVTIPTEPLSESARSLGEKLGWKFVTEGAIDRDHSGPGPIEIECEMLSDPGKPSAPALRPVLAANDPAIPELEASLTRFCDLFPNAFAISERGPYFDPEATGHGRLLTAGFHLMQGYFRDDTPLRDLILDEDAERELDGLWQELAFVSQVPQRQYKDFIFFERAEPPRFMTGAEFDFARSEDKDATSAAKIEQLREAYLKQAAKVGADKAALAAIDTYFTNISAEIRWVEQARLAAEPGHLEALLSFAERAYRRPLSDAERDDLLGFYRELRQQDEFGHEDAMRDVLATVLLSPHFSYRIDLAEPGQAPRALTDFELASRLSYFLWSSIPDAELLAHASRGDLHQPEILAAQTHRMLGDDRIRALAVEFLGNWLEFRRFEEHNSVDRSRFPTFSNELRQAMYEEPIRFFIDVAQQNRSVLDLAYGDHTFVNPLLAEHYGISIGKNVKDSEWVRVDDAGRYGRGGLLPMSVFLTKSSPGLRTSPVKRGYWVVRRLLGEHIPAPPAEVPELPKDEATLGDLTLAQLLARHREHKSCAVCHQRFDSVGLVFEGYGPIGERRQRDLGNRPINSTAAFPDGSEGTGLDGLRHYLATRRQDDFLDNFCRKFLSYALGRSLLLSDKQTLESMKSGLATDSYRFETAVQTIVASPQFRNKRGGEAQND